MAVVALTAALGLAPLGAEGQRLDIEPSRPVPNVVPVGPAPPRLREVPRGPRFVSPLSIKTTTGRAGVAGWTAPPAVPVGPSTIQGADANGVLGLGFAVEWGRPGGRSTETN
jgi:hypothetical protein